MPSRHVHFWTPDALGDCFDSWDPDKEPERYATGVGHCILEPYKRLELRGRPVSVGPVPPPDAHLFFHLTSLWDWERFRPRYENRRRLLGLLARQPSATVVRADVPLEYSVRSPHVVEVMPNKASITGPRQVWLPLLPQRGLIRRDPSRRGTVTTVGLISYLSGIPRYFLSDEFRHELDRLGMTLVAFTYGKNTPPPNWHDLASVDCILCVRTDPWHQGPARKPATRLINAWAAGAIAIVGNEPAYRELATLGQDALEVERPEEVPGVLASLRADPDLVRTLEEGSLRQGARFSTEHVLDRWEELLFEGPREPLSAYDRMVLSKERVSASLAVPLARADVALRRSIGRLTGRR